MFQPKLVLAITAAAACVLFADDKPDLAIINRIKAEAFENSKVMDHAFYLTDVYGPRLTNTPEYKTAAEWTAKRLTEYGLANVALEKWGPYGRGWSYSKFSGSMIEPRYTPLIGFPLAWSKGTDGPVSGEAIQATLRTEADLTKWKGKLKGKIVLIDAARELVPQTTPPAKRFSDADLATEGLAPDPAGSAASSPDPRVSALTVPGGPRTLAELSKWRGKVRQFLIDEQVLVVVQIGRGDGGTVFGQASGTREMKDAVAMPTVSLTAEHYNRIVRLIDHKIPVKLEFDIKTTLYEDSLDSLNIVGEIPGGKKKDEVVMIGAHFDSWQGGTGATDNAAGSAVAIEVMRILKTLDVKMDRTVRIGLWSGEESGLLGSKAYVKKHFGDPETMKVLPEHAKLDAYYNLDNGTGKIRGIYLQGNDMARPIFESWFVPFKDLGAGTVTIRNTGGTDHLSFNNVGLPGFNFMQDQIEYATRTHHSNMDVYDRLQKGDLMQAAAIMATFVYETAMREQMLPRKPLPKPQPATPAPTHESKPEDGKKLVTSAE
jgi:carboxypeptidase Q